jgi:hypothetical protein
MQGYLFGRPSPQVADHIPDQDADFTRTQLLPT